jgi:predicted transcriptional regulator
MDAQNSISAERRREAWRLRQEGWTQERIAAHLGIRQQSVCEALQRIERELAETFKAQALEIKARQTAQLERIAEEALLRWQESVGEVVRETVTSGRVRVLKDADGNEHTRDLPDQVARTVEYQSGNPALLEKAMNAMADVRKIWGLDAPQKVDSTVTQEVKWYGQDAPVEGI